MKLGQVCPHCKKRMTTSNAYVYTSGVFCRARVKASRLASKARRKAGIKGRVGRPKQTWSAGIDLGVPRSASKVPARIWTEKTGWRDVVVVDSGTGVRTVRPVRKKVAA